MKKFIQITTAYNHRLNKNYLEFVVSSDLIQDHVRHYIFHWMSIDGKYSSIAVEFKKHLNHIRQDSFSNNYKLFTTEKNYNQFKDQINAKMLELAANPIDLKWNYIELDSFCK